MVPVYILQLETLEDLLRQNNPLRDEKQKQFQKFKEDLKKLAEGKPIGKML